MTFWAARNLLGSSYSRKTVLFIIVVHLAPTGEGSRVALRMQEWILAESLLPLSTANPSSL
jgi:hypothetical protein